MRYFITRDFTSNFLINADFLMLYILLLFVNGVIIYHGYIPFSNCFRISRFKSF